MSSKLLEGGLYVNEEDLAGAPLGVVEFLLNLKDKKSNKTGRRDRRKTEIVLKTQQEELGELIKSLTETVQKLAEQDALRSTAHGEVLSWSSVLDNINALVAEKRKKSKDSESGEASVLWFDRDAVMVDVPAEADDEPVVETSQVRTPLGTLSAPINVELLPAEDVGPTGRTLPDLSGSESDILEELVRFGIKHWPVNNLGCFRPGQLVTGHILDELLRADLQAQYALGIPPNRINKLKEKWEGIVFPYYVNDVDQLSEVEGERNHFVVAFVNKRDNTFTSWGMSEAMGRKSKAAYEKALGIDLVGVRFELGEYTGNCCALRCVEAIRSYFNIDTTIRNEVSLRLFFLKRLLKSWIGTDNQAVEVRAPGDTQPGIVATGNSPTPHLKTSFGDSAPFTTTGLPFSGPSDRAIRPKTARTPLPSIPTKQVSAGRRNSQAPSTKPEATMPVRTQLGTARQISPGRSSRKRSANEFPASTQGQEKDDTGTESVGPPPKRNHKETPPPEILAEELTGSGAIERIRRHVLACNQDTTAFPKAWDEQGDWAKQTGEVLNLAREWDEKSEFSRLVALILRTHAVQRIYIEARSILKLDKEAPDPILPAHIIDQVSPHLRKQRTPAALSKWLTLAKRLFKLVDYLPFIPFGSKGSVTFRQYERLPNEHIQQIRNLLDNDPRAQRLAKIGRAFRDRILKRQAFLWEGISSEELSKLPDDTLLHLLTIRRGADPESIEPDSVGKQCDLCEEERCNLFTFGHDLASKQPTSPAGEHDDCERAASPDTTAQHHNNTATGLGPQLQLAFPVIVPDTAQSITFAMNGNIDGLKHLFSLKLASPNERSYSRGFSLLRWALYGGHSGMHHYETVQFLLDHGAHTDDESYETVGYYNLSNKYSNTDRQALRGLARRDRHWFKEQNFPLVHQIIFGLSPKSLADELSQNPNAAFATDAQGRTALDWATVRAQLDDMNILIAHGSSSNSMDIFGRTTILHAVDSRDTEALRIVLKAGADPEPQIPKGLFRGNPLTSANLNGLPGMVELLIQFGAQIDAANPEGLTALHSAAVSQNFECASILLAHSADMDYMSSNGYTPLMTAIMHNSHAVLKLLLSKRADRLNSNLLLPIVAEHADSETMSILASSQLFNPSGDCLPADRAILSCRKDYNDALGHAFESLVANERA